MISFQYEKHCAGVVMPKKVKANAMLVRLLQKYLREIGVIKCKDAEKYSDQLSVLY